MIDTPLKAALLRGVIIAVISAGTALFATWPASDLQTASISAGAVFFTTLAARFGGEGYVDQGSAMQRATDARKANAP